MEATNEVSTIISAVTDHAHHWVINEANGPISSGTCKRCGAGRLFKNWLEEGDFTTNEEHRIAA